MQVSRRYWKRNLQTTVSAAAGHDGAERWSEEFECMELESPLFLIWAAFTLVLAVGLGFAAGFNYARGRDRRSLERARSCFAQLFESVVRAMETACEACGYLEQFPGGGRLSAEQFERLDRTRQRLQEQVAKIVERRWSADTADQGQKPDWIEPAQVKWTQSPEDSTTGLPNRTAFLANLEALLGWGRPVEQPSGLLLVKLDRYDGLKDRYGLRDAQKLLKKFALVLCRSVRDVDLVCQYSIDTYAILLPAVAPVPVERLAEVVRDSIRCHHFRLEEDGPEVLITASLGYTPCRPQDNADLAVNRAADALARSQRVGRNQLHIHDGSTLTHCLVG